MARQRVDAHRPAGMVPGNYRYLASSYGYKVEDAISGRDETIIEWDGTDEWEAMGEPRQSTCEHALPGRCDHCGAWHTYQTILLYIPTGELLSVGNTCAVERFGRPEWKNVIADGARRAELKAERAHKTALALAAMDEATRAAYEWASADENANRIAQDIVQKVERFGPLSEKQAAFLVKLHTEAQEKVRKVETGEVAPCPVGRLEVCGAIVSVKEVDDSYAGRWGAQTKLKMLVQDDRGFRVFGTAPEALLAAAWARCEEDGSPFRCSRDAMKGMRVQFTATVEPKKDDPTFGFFTRPTKAAVVEASP